MTLSFVTIDIFVKRHNLHMLLKTEICGSSVLITDLFEVENKPSDPEVNQKARDFYKGCLNEGKYTVT